MALLFLVVVIFESSNFYMGHPLFFPKYKFGNFANRYFHFSRHLLLFTCFVMRFLSFPLTELEISSCEEEVSFSFCSKVIWVSDWGTAAVSFWVVSILTSAPFKSSFWSSTWKATDFFGCSSCWKRCNMRCNLKHYKKLHTYSVYRLHNQYGIEFKHCILVLITCSCSADGSLFFKIFLIAFTSVFSSS